jgi:hypothetical protein
MDESELAQCYALLGLAPGADRDVLKRALMQKNFALIRAGAPEAEREQLRAAHDAIVAHLDALEVQQAAAHRAAAREGIEERKLEKLVADFEAEEKAREPELSRWDPRSFDSRIVNIVAPPLVAALAIGIKHSVLGQLLMGFQIWTHEFGHAIVAWMSGYRALPLPIGWATVDPQKSLFVYFGVLFLFSLLFVSGVREKRPVAVLAAVVLALVQAGFTWKVSEAHVQMWITFGGIGGEFLLAAAMIVLFFFQLPEKFQWGGCRYVFLAWGAMSFFEAFSFWRLVRRGLEGIPYGTLLYGEDDANGDMNKLHDDYDWTQSQIIYTYNHLGTACLAVILFAYLWFAMRLDRPVAKWLQTAET